MDTQVKLEHEVSFRCLIVFALPTILSSIFSSLYSTVDGIFIARLVDTDALSAINITMPMIFLASAIGMMFGSGGNALVAKKLGEGKQREAQEDFSLGTGRRSYCIFEPAVIFSRIGSSTSALLQGIYDSGFDHTAFRSVWNGISA